MGKQSHDHIIFFDGYCNLCNGFIQWIIKRDPDGIFHFAPLSSAFAQKKLNYDLKELASVDSIILWEHGEVYIKSTAALRIASKLPFPWPLFGIFRVVPVFLRNLIYDQIAKHRYQWFGKRQECMVPTPDVQKRFIENMD